jgi:hypothetical protein
MPRTTFKHTDDIRLKLNGFADMCAASQGRPAAVANLGVLEPLVSAVLKLADEVDSLRSELQAVRSERR